MAGRTPRDAFGPFARAFQQALSCVPLAGFHAEGYRPIDQPYSADINGGEAVPLSGGLSIGLIVVLRYRATQDGRSAGAWEMETTEYYYALTGEAAAEILAYHWHPRSRSPIIRPTCTSVQPSADYRGRPLGRTSRPAPSRSRM